MSLINDALKKAQRQRTNNPFGVEPPMPGGGGRVAKRGKAMPAQTLMLIVAGSALLIVLSVVATVFLVNGKHPAKPAAPALSPVAKAPTPDTAPPPALVLPKIELPATLVTPPAPVPVAVAAPSRVETAAAHPPVTVTSAPIETKPEPKPVMPVLKPTPDERINVFLDGLRITGIRSSGSDSRVMMNEHVYRLNDLVDRSLGLKLTTVASDHLSFTDANGITYDKNF